MALISAATSAELIAAFRAAALAEAAAGKIGFKQDDQGVPIPGVLPDQFETVIRVIAEGLAPVWQEVAARTAVVGVTTAVTPGVGTAPLTGTLL